MAHHSKRCCPQRAAAAARSAQGNPSVGAAQHGELPCASMCWPLSATWQAHRIQCKLFTVSNRRGQWTVAWRLSACAGLGTVHMSACRSTAAQRKLRAAFTTASCCPRVARRPSPRAPWFREISPSCSPGGSLHQPALLERPSDGCGAAAAAAAAAAAPPCLLVLSAAAVPTGRPTGKIAILCSVGCCWCNAAAPARQQTRPRDLDTTPRLPKATQLIFPHKNTATFTTNGRRGQHGLRGGRYARSASDRPGQ